MVLLLECPMARSMLGRCSKPLAVYDIFGGYTDRRDSHAPFFSGDPKVWLLLRSRGAIADNSIPHFPIACLSTDSEPKVTLLAPGVDSWCHSGVSRFQRGLFYPEGRTPKISIGVERITRRKFLWNTLPGLFLCWLERDILTCQCGDITPF
jgi:hypothetical protein